MKKLIKKTILLFALLILYSCVEPYALQTNTFEDYLVVEATITNELKQQEVKLSRTYKLEQGKPTLVQGAAVTISDNQGNNYSFAEIGGRYLSNTAFKAFPGRTYQLKITTSNGKKYSSIPETLTSDNPIQSLTPEVVTRSDGETGVEMTIRCFDPTNSSKYYRYEFEETYKVISPLWNGVRPDFIVTPPLPDVPALPVLIQIPYEAKTCYSSIKSNKIILNSTNNQSEDRVDFPVQFVKKRDYKLANRYSINVVQYVENLAAHTYYKTLNGISGNNGVLTQSQPGFIYGNLSCESNSEEKVIGYFEVASFSTKRLFINYTDVFPGQILLEYPFKCSKGRDVASNPNQKQNFKDYTFCPTCDGEYLVAAFNAGTISYFTNISLRFEIYPIQCGDCTSFSSNIRPSFWID